MKHVWKWLPLALGGIYVIWPQDLKPGNIADDLLVLLFVLLLSFVIVKMTSAASPADHAPSHSAEKTPESKNAPSHSDDKTPESKNAPSHSDDKTSESKNAPCHSDDKTPESKNAPYHSDNKTPESKNAPCHSDDKTPESNYINVTSQFTQHFGVRNLAEAFWTSGVRMDPETGKYYVWEAKWQAGDPPSGWYPLGSSFEDACDRLLRSYKIRF